ncbi:penicillin-binding protein [Pelotalea chapellei]|uniref:Transpeptidase family protein n=1 Tax=Pelotalea chapellei TaxID=44671 RepID=A0ABS5U8V7_9BACT|nr:penicillin-binding protein [Pelotalea chapellei]MBT1072081.1 transpeptidase family protein [Pelotalea chapellei]
MQDEREKWARTRIIIIGTFFGLLFLAVTGQAFKLQILQHEDMLKKADRQHQRIVQLTPVRGTIMDRNGNKLAVSLEMDSCFAEPRSIQDIEGTAAVLAPFLATTPKELVKKLNSSKNFVWLERRLTPERAAPIKNLKLRGIGFAPEPKRYYPNMEVAAHVIGFTGLDPAGLEGIELKYDSTIIGNTGYMVTERDALGRNIALKNSVVKNSSPGKNLVLTLDMTIQHIVERELAKAVTESQAKGGMALVMESDTGKILALANYPTFNPNSFAQHTHAQLRNKTVADSFEPGSTFKIFVIAAALEEKLVNPSEVFNCENGVYKIADRIIHDDHPHPRLSVSEIIKYSSNIGSAKIGFKLGEERLSRYLRNFGFGERTGIDLPGEAQGSLKKRWYGIDLATTSFGQGVSLSTVQLASAVSSIANGGLLMKPYLVERILDDTGQEVQKIEPQVLRRVISAETAQKVTRMMETVTGEGGTGTKAAVEGFRVAGKTGTAQKVDPLTRSYSPSKRVGSFVGFVPANKPKLTIAVIIDEPQGVKYGGVVAAPAFHGIALNSLAYLKIMPSGDLIKAPKVTELKANNTSPGEAAVIEAMAEGDALDALSPGDVAMPDFRGMSMRRVLQVMEKRKINIKLIGSGRAMEQHPSPGQAIRGTGEVWVKFAPSA